MANRLKGVNQHAMNNSNRYLILRTLSTVGPCSRTQLCEYTGLSKMTITNLVNDYKHQGIVEESGKAETLAGRKSGMLRIVSDSVLAIGIYVDRGYTEIGLVNLAGRVLRSERFDLAPEDTVEDFLGALTKLCSVMVESEYRDRIWGIGISAMGPVDNQNGIILQPPGFNFKNIHIVEVIYEMFKIPTFLELGTHVGALSEIYYGNKKGFDNFLCLSVDNWLGGCVVINRMVFQGSSGLAALMGGVVVDRDAMDPARSLSGCLQDYASILGVIKWARENGPDPAVTWNHIVTGARKGETFANSVLDRLIRYLEVGIVNAIALLDIQCVYISGPVIQAEDLIFKRLEESVNRIMFAPETRRLEILPAKYSSNVAQVVGAMPLVLERRFEQYPR